MMMMMMMMRAIVIAFCDSNPVAFMRENVTCFKAANDDLCQSLVRHFAAYITSYRRRDFVFGRMCLLRCNVATFNDVC